MRTSAPCHSEQLRRGPQDLQGPQGRRVVYRWTFRVGVLPVCLLQFSYVLFEKCIPHVQSQDADCRKSIQEHFEIAPLNCLSDVPVHSRRPAFECDSASKCRRYCNEAQSVTVLLVFSSRKEQWANREHWGSSYWWSIPPTELYKLPSCNIWRGVITSMGERPKIGDCVDRHTIEIRTHSNVANRWMAALLYMLASYPIDNVTR